MAKTKLTDRGTSDHRLTDKERIFVHEYKIDHNATRAAKAAGYRHPQVAGSRLLSKPKIAAAVGKAEAQAIEKLDLKLEDVLQRLFYMVTRDAKALVSPKSGKLLPIHKLQAREAACIDGIKQTEFIDEDGRVKRVTEYKLASLVGAMDMAMKRFGAYAAQKQDIVLQQFNWDAVALQGQRVDEVERQIAEAEAARIITAEPVQTEE